MGGDGLADLATVAAAQADGSYYTLAAPDATRLPSAQAFVKAYRAKYNSDIGPYSANAYAAAQVAADAIIRAIATERRKGPLPSRPAVVARVASTKLDTPIGPISFDKYGDVTNPVLSLYGFKNGQPYFIRQIQLKI
jgi:branched-chain amino acid transport system substrate-binding protein